MVKSENNKSYFMNVKDFSSNLEGRFTRKMNFIWKVSECEELVGENFLVYCVNYLS